MEFELYIKNSETHRTNYLTKVIAKLSFFLKTLDKMRYYINKTG